MSTFFEDLPYLDRCDDDDDDDDDESTLLHRSGNRLPPRGDSGGQW